MKAKHLKMETVIPKVVSGQIEKGSDRIDFRRKDGSVVRFSPESHSYLEQLCHGKSVQNIILNNFKNGVATDFVLLQKTLLTLYWSHSIRNGYNFRQELERSDWIPTSDSHLLKPFKEFDLENKSFVVRFLAMTIAVGSIDFAYQLFSSQNVSAIALLFVPMCFLSMRTIISVILNSFLGQTPPRLSIHFSYFGIYLRESSAESRTTGPAEYLLNLAAVLLLGFGTFKVFDRISAPEISGFGTILIALLVTILNSPGYKSELSNLLPRLKKRESPFVKGIYAVGVLSYILTATGFYGLAFAKVLKVANSWTEISHVPYFIFMFLAVIFFLDILDTFEFILSHFSKSLGSPIKSFLANLFNVNSKGRLTEILKKMPIFSAMPSSILAEMHKSSRIVQVRQGNVICRSGQLSTDLYVIIKGKVGIYNSDSKGKFSKVMELKAGSIFGEGGFFLNKPRNGEAITLTDATLLYVSRPKELESTIKNGSKINSTFQKKMWAYQALVSSQLFKDIPSELIMLMIDKGTIVDLPPQKVLIREGDSSDSLYVLVEGECSASSENGHGTKIKAGSVIGEIGILWNSRRTMTVTSTTSVITLRIDAQEIWKILSLSLSLGATLQTLGHRRLVKTAA